MPVFVHKRLNPPMVRSLIRQHIICLGGNKRLRIYGTLHCASGKRMKQENRVFFTTVAEANEQGYRPCGHCLRKEYAAWKQSPDSKASP